MSAPGLVILVGGSSAMLHSRRNPGALVAQLNDGTLVRGGVSVRVPRRVLHYIVALTARPGAILSIDELVELLFGDRADGGPDHARSAIYHAASAAAPALIALGYRLETHRGRGHAARCCRPAPSVVAEVA